MFKKEKNSLKEIILLTIMFGGSIIAIIGGINIDLSYFKLPLIWKSFFGPIIGTDGLGVNLFDVCCNSIIFIPTMVLTLWCSFYLLFLSKPKK